MTTLPEKLSREIERVTILRAAYVLTESAPGGPPHYGPMIAIMTAAIEAGHTAAGNGDQVEMIAAIRHLEGFKP